MASTTTYTAWEGTATGEQLQVWDHPRLAKMGAGASQIYESKIIKVLKWAKNDALHGQQLGLPGANLIPPLLWLWDGSPRFPSRLSW